MEKKWIFTVRQCVTCAYGRYRHSFKRAQKEKENPLEPRALKQMETSSSGATFIIIMVRGVKNYVIQCLHVHILC